MNASDALRAKHIHGKQSEASSVPLKNWLAVIGTAIGAFMAILDIQITASSLRDIQGGLGASVDEGSWISTSYLIAEIVTIPLTGWLSRVFSPRVYIIANATLFIVFSILCGMAHDLPTMIMFRAAQGFTGGILIPMAFSTIMEMLPPSQQPIGLAIFSMSATFAPSIGPAIGGYITDNFSWPYIFFLNLIPGVILISMLLYAMPKSKMQLGLLKKNDIAGIITMATGLSSLIYVLEEGQRKDWFGSQEISGAAIVAAVSLIIFVIREITAKNPLVNPGLFIRRNFGLGTLANISLGFALYGSVYLLPLYLAIVHGYSASQIGQVLMWSGLPQLLITPFVPGLMKKIDARLLITFGLAMFGISCAMNGFMSHDYAGEQLILSMLVRAIGMPFIITPLSALATNGIDKEQMGSASALFNMMRNLGGSLGTALSSTLIVQREQFHSTRLYEHISDSDVIVRQWIKEASAGLQHAGASAWSAHEQSLQVLADQVRRESYIMSFNDAFLCVAIVLFVGAFTVLLLKKSGAPLDTSAGH